MTVPAFDPEAVEWWPEEEPLVRAAEEAHDTMRASVVRPLTEFRHDPVRFASEVLGIPSWTIRWSELPEYADHEWDGTPDPLATAVEALARGQDVGIESCTGSGKSFTLGWAQLWFVSCWHGARVFSWATKLEQLEIYSFAEMRKFFPRFRRRFTRARLYTSTQRLRLYMDPADRQEEDADDAWGIFGRSAAVRSHEEVATRASGMHGAHMLISMEEMQGIDPAITKAIKATCTGQHNLRWGVGNPDHQHDALHQFCRERSVRHVRISALDIPNVVVNAARDPEWEDVDGDRELIPGAATRKFVRMMRDGPNGEDGRLYLTRVRGISPEQASDALIRAEWVREAFERYRDEGRRAELMAQGASAMGVDVARSEDGDRAAIAVGQGAVLTGIQSFPCDDVVQLAIRVGAQARLLGVKERHIGVDSVGVGGGTADFLKVLGLRARELNGGAKAVRLLDKDAHRDELEAYLQAAEFLNLRAQMLWQLARDLERGRIALAPDEDLLRDLVIPTWTTRSGKIVVEPKEEIRKRLQRSPDRGDAVAYWNFVRYRYPEQEEPEEARAFDREVLEHESDVLRRVRSGPARPQKKVDPLIHWRL